MTKTMMKYNIEDKEEDENMRRSDIQNNDNNTEVNKVYRNMYNKKRKNNMEKCSCMSIGYNMREIFRIECI